MELKTYNWNNGTQSSPIVLTTDQIKKFIAIGRREDIETTVNGFVTTSSRKMQKFLKYALEEQFPDLNIVCDEELADSFRIQMMNTTINEGTSEPINIITDTGITHDFLKWKYEYSNFSISGNISEQNIKDRIRVENGYLVIDIPKENATWSVNLKLTAYPVYYDEADLAKVPDTSKPDINLTIVAKAITGITVYTDQLEYPINTRVIINAIPSPSNSTKLRGVYYTYTTTTPNTITINTSNLGQEVFTKAQGSATVVAELHACDNTVVLTDSITFNIYDLRPINYIIDQRGLNNLTDPDGMVSENFIFDAYGNIQSVSPNGAYGDPNNNLLTWLKLNTHAYVSKHLGLSGVNLKQLDDNDRTKFADGTSAIAYISNEDGYHDVFLKFPCDIYIRTRPFTPPNESEPNQDYVLITIAKELPEGEDINDWLVWPEHHLIGVYEASELNNKLYSLSGKRVATNQTYNTYVTKSVSRGANFSICNYDSFRLFCFLFWGFYSTLDSQSTCGYGSTTLINGVNHPRITGLTDYLGMTDTTEDDGNPTEEPVVEDIELGFGENIVSVNFWGIENKWGNQQESIIGLVVAYTGAISDPETTYLSSLVGYIKKYGSVNVVSAFKENKVYTSAEELLQDYPLNFKFINVVERDRVIRSIATNTNITVNRYVTKMQLCPNTDVIGIAGASTSVGYSDLQYLGVSQNICYVGYHTNTNYSGISQSYMYNKPTETNTTNMYGTRIMYQGTENTVHIVNDISDIN